MFSARRLLVIGLILIILSVAAGLYYGLNAWQNISVTPRHSQVARPTSILPTPTPDPDRPFSILLLGYGGGTHEGGKNTDTMMVIKIDPKTKTNLLISIPRDLWVPIPLVGSTETWYKINAAYPIGSNDRLYPHKNIEYTGEAGGGTLAKYVTSNVTGMPVDYFVAVDFTGFEKVIDTLGGVTITVDKSFEDPFYPLDTGTTDPCGRSEDEVKAITATMSGDKLEQMFTCRYEDLRFTKGSQLMDGVTALKFARSRHSLTDGGDFNRARRQRLVLEAVKEKVLSLNFIPKIIPTINTLKNHVQTDMDMATVEKLLSRFTEFSQYPVTQIALTDQNVLVNAKSADGQFILSPRIGMGDWSEIHSYISDPNSLVVTPHCHEIC